MRYGIATLLLFTFFGLTWSAGQAGLSSLLSAYGSGANQMPSANLAVNLRAQDPDVHYVMASMLVSSAELDDALREYEKAVALRSDDHVLWVELGRARDLSGDQDGALSASRKAVQLAPYYAQPRWQLGNLLSRAGGTHDEAFMELRRAAASDPTFLPVFIDLVGEKC